MPDEDVLAGCLPQIARMREQLLQTSKYIEESVIEVCDSFQGIAGRARGTVARTQQIAQCLGQLNTHTAREMAAMLENMTAESASLAADIGAAVRSLQFQDRTSQRIGHVVEGLDALYALLTKQTGHVRNVSAPEHAADEDCRAYTMQEERAVAGVAGTEAPAGDVELF